MKQVAILFARADSVYKTLEGCDVFDIERDARNWKGGAAVVAHPPCRAWGNLRHFAKPRADEKSLALFAVHCVRAYGGVLEHPKRSTLWPHCSLPDPGRRDVYGGWTMVLPQHAFGHRAEKMTLLYIVGIEPSELPAFPLRIDEPTHVIGTSKKKRHIPECTKAEREHTPAAFAEWLVALARQCDKSNSIERLSA